MRVYGRHGDVEIHFEREPMPPERFKVVAGILGGAVYAAGLFGITHLTGLIGLVTTLIMTVLAIFAKTD